MIKMKKLFAVVLAIAMLFTMSSIAASADGTPSVTVAADKANYAVGEKIDVTVTVENAGAVDFVLNYNKDAIEYVTATFDNKAVNKEADSIKVGDGNVRVFLLDGGAKLTFKAVAAGTMNFTVSDAVASNTTGTEKSNVNVESFTVTAVSEGHIEVLGATTRDTANIDEQDLGFIGKLFVPEDKEVEKFGIIAAFTNELNNNSVADADFTLDTMDALNTETTNKVAHKVVEDQDLINSILENEENEGKFVSHVKTTGSYDLMGKNITARFYVKFKDSDDVIYSNNISVVNGAVIADNGVAKKSMVQVLGSQISAICNNENATQDIVDAGVKAVNDYNNRDKENKEAVEAAKEALLTFVHTNKGLLNATNG